MSETAFASLQVWEYRDPTLPHHAVAADDAARDTPTSTPSTAATDGAVSNLPPCPPGFTEAEVQARVRSALAEAEAGWVAACKAGEERRETQLRDTLGAFAEERTRYFRHAETEVVHLALAIARKVLGREAVLDPELLAALVRMALDRIEAGPLVRLRIPAAEAGAWQERKGLVGARYQVDLVTDPALAPGECHVETEMGTAPVGWEAQFKEIEEGVLDLLDLRPAESVSTLRRSREVPSHRTSGTFQASRQDEAHAFPVAAGRATL